MAHYRIFCEWDMGFDDYYESIEEAEKAINETDWSEVLDEGETIDDLRRQRLVGIKELKKKDL